MAPLLELVDVEARYGAVPALHGVALAVAEGEVVALLGANGAGKTTVLRAVSGTVARSGRIALGGRELPRGAPDAVARLGVAHVPEGRGTLAALSVRDNLRVGALARRGRADLARLEALFPVLAERRDQPAGTLSGGEQQLLALARALAARPRLLMLDEPSLGLAPLAARAVFAALERVSREEGFAVLLVEQNARAALRVAARAYVLEVGRVALAGPSAELAAADSVRRSYLGV